MPVGYESYPTSVKGLRTAIKQLSREHGKAVYEKDDEHEDGGKWKIPLGAYQSFYAYLNSQPGTQVDGIPETQLKIASLGKARLEKDYPSVDKMVSIGVPRELSEALAPFQRGGVEFVHEKGGRALIADVSVHFFVLSQKPSAPCLLTLLYDFPDESRRWD
jgi:hypothetical protein